MEKEIVSSGRVNGTFVKLFSRQSTIPSAHRQGCGHKLRPPHSIGACSVNPKSPSKTRIKLHEEHFIIIYGISKRSNGNFMQIFKSHCEVQLRMDGKQERQQRQQLLLQKFPKL
ncbi:CLUMA_CG000642, isoform A [Clunio marinus]|uniref:CLUMA_CG000642, isoform A n=1 Tax=Clunio marinus TaxID=568069 RepID=A0A1J1HG19_9DIPT|nr:CLUMA_CG000642, isoform A [Clunio marinus]